METQLIQFHNHHGETLRGIATFPVGESVSTTIFLHGFERAGTTEKKFKALQDELTKKWQSCLRFDFTGCGMSDGDFRNTTLASMDTDFKKAIEVMSEQNPNEKLNIVTHSLGAVVLASEIKKLENRINKIVLIAPALNQKDLLRYWFVTLKMKKVDPTLQITWENYVSYLSEEEFLVDCAKEDRMTKMNYIDHIYFLEAKDMDLSGSFTDMQSKILHVHGDRDMAVPKASLNTAFENIIGVKWGDHDMERPDQMKQWFGGVVEFLCE